MSGPPSSEAESSSNRLGFWLGLLALQAGAVGFRLPLLVNAGALNSDAAVVGLQAMHILQGEWDWFVWGAGYQGAFEPLLAAGAFALLGATPLVLVGVTLLGALVALGLTYSVVARRVGVLSAVLLALVLVVAAPSVTRTSVQAPRQWCFTFLAASVWFFDRSSESHRPALLLALGAILAGLAVYLDMIAVPFLPGLVLLALLCAFDVPGAARSARLRRLAACVLGALSSLAFLLYIRAQAENTTPMPPVHLARLSGNLELLLQNCLPWLLGSSPFILLSWKEVTLPHMPPLIAAARQAAAVLFVAGLCSGGALALVRSIPGRVRRLGVAGFLFGFCSIAGFLVSPAPQDIHGARYLVPVVLGAPLALAPLAWLLGARPLALFLAPFLLSITTAGWIGYGPFVRGPLPALHPRGAAEEEAQLARELRQRGIRYGAADYYLAYRLTFLFGEDPILVPLKGSLDRYAPYRRAAAAAPRIALVFHPSEPRADPRRHEFQLLTSGAAYERLQVAGFTVLLLRQSGQ